MNKSLNRIESVKLALEVLMNSEAISVAGIDAGLADEAAYSLNAYLGSLENKSAKAKLKSSGKSAENAMLEEEFIDMMVDGIVYENSHFFGVYEVGGVEVEVKSASKVSAVFKHAVESGVVVKDKVSVVNAFGNKASHVGYKLAD